VGIAKVPRFCVQSAGSNATRACVPWLHTVVLVHDRWAFSLAAQAWPTTLWWQHVGRGGSEFLSTPTHRCIREHLVVVRQLNGAKEDTG
jgi:hypothetical protein